MVEFSTFGPLLFSTGLMLVMFAVFGRGSRVCRVIAAALCSYLTFRYLWWHLTLGMPKGRCSVLPGLGIQTRLTARG
jgi:hypothetical protein